MKRKQRYRGIPVYRESGYMRRIKPVARWELCLWAAAVVLLLALAVAVLLARNGADWVERYYSLGFYPVWAGFVSALTGKLPFSLAEVLLVLLVIAVIACLVILAVTIHRYQMHCGRLLCRAFMRLLSAVTAILLLFLMGGGLNYYRYTFTRYSGLEPLPSEVSQLEELCTELAAEANSLRTELTEDEQGVSVLSKQGIELSRQANEGYTALITAEPKYSELLKLAEKTPPKQVTFSEAMSYMQIVGFFFPYTIEANVNIHIVDFGIPSAMSHELAHIAGFMREDEANFIAYLACRANPDPDFRYSGTMLALIHSTNALYNKDPQAHGRIIELLNDGVRRDMTSDSLYYQKYDTKFGDFSTAVNDVYLKVNNQSGGVASYGRMVDLLLADYRLRHGVT